VCVGRCIIILVICVRSVLFMRLYGSLGQVHECLCAIMKIEWSCARNSSRKKSIDLERALHVQGTLVGAGERTRLSLEARWRNIGVTNLLKRAFAAGHGKFPAICTEY
jgi:hypothetical protein